MSSLRPQRTDSDWLTGLRDPADSDAVEELRSQLRAGLVRAFGGRSDVCDADLDDFAQEGTLRVLSHLDSFRGDSRLTTWATAVAIRVAFTKMRRRHWGDRSLDDLGLGPDAPAASATTAPDPIARTDLLDALRDAIARDLTARQRSAILGELAGVPGDVLAEQLGTNRNALYKLHHDARRRLRTSLEENGFSNSDVTKILEGASQE